MSNSSVLDAIVVTCCVELFADYGVTLSPGPSQDHGDGFLMCAVIGFSGDHVRGSLMLASTGEPLGGSHPTGATGERAWIAELSNQLLGRIKNRVLAHGATICVATPLVLRGQHLAPVPRAELAPHPFVADTGGHVCLWLDAEIAEGFDLTVEPRVVPGAPAEGEALMF